MLVIFALKLSPWLTFVKGSEFCEHAYAHDVVVWCFRVVFLLFVSLAQRSVSMAAFFL